MPTQYGVSDVYIRERDLTQVIRERAASNCALVGAFSRGPVEVTDVTEDQQFVNRYGKPDPAISLAADCAVIALKRASRLSVRRVVGPGTNYAGLLFKDGAVVTTNKYSLYGYATLDPQTADFSSAGTGTNLAYFYSWGPGAYGNKVRISIASRNVHAPANVVATDTTNQLGKLTAGVHRYIVTALSKQGESLGSTAASVTLAGADNAVDLTWDAVPGATNYRIYKGAAASEELLATVDTFNRTFTDLGTLVTDSSITIPGAGVASGTSDRQTISNVFTVYVFDDNVSSISHVEAYDCTLADVINGQGINTELEAQINTQSEYIRVINIAKQVGATPSDILYTIDKTSLSGGTDGSLPTLSEVAAGWDSFTNVDERKVSILINGGYADPSVQRAMKDVAEVQRAVCLFDLPSNKQKASEAANYARLELNINSNRCEITSPDIKWADTYNGTQRYTCSSGIIAKLLANTDGIANPGRSAAGLNRGVVDEALDVRYRYTDGERAILADSLVNYFRVRAGKGVVWWEQNTLQDQFSSLSFLSVRRILDVIELSISDALEYSLQEPNDDFLGEQIVQMITEYLDSLATQRVISKFQVISNKSNNPKNVINVGQRNVDVFITPILPVYAIQLQVTLTKEGANFNELLTAA